VKQNHDIQIQEARRLKNIRIFRISLDEELARPSRVFPPACWNPQTKLLHTTGKDGKFAAFYYASTTHYLKVLVVLGLSSLVSSLGAPWCHILHASRSPDIEWTSFQPTGKEGLNSVVKFGGEKLSMTPGTEYNSLSVSISAGQIYASIVFDVEISMNRAFGDRTLIGFENLETHEVVGYLA
jgi:hypothetical protein